MIAGTDPFDPCDFNVTDISLPQGGDFLDADCDGDGVTNGQEIADGTDPSDPCDFNVANQDITTVAEPFLSSDCDGDGETNGEEITNGTDIFDPCDVTVQTIPDPADENYAIWAAADCDGDGVTNGDEVLAGTDPFDPCDFNEGCLLYTSPSPRD